MKTIRNNNVTRYYVSLISMCSADDFTVTIKEGVLQGFMVPRAVTPAKA